MTYDTHTDQAITAQIEELHDHYATEEGRDNVFITPILRDDGLVDISIIIGNNVGELAMNDDITISMERGVRLP